MLNNFRLILFVTLSAMLGADMSFAHSIDFKVSGQEAQVVEIFYPDGRPFLFEDYEVFGPGDSSPFMTGRTDKLGRAIFIPDRTGQWLVKIWSEDGHGLQTTVLVEDLNVTSGNVSETQHSHPTNSNERFVGLAVGLALIFLIGIVLTVQSRKKKT